jgi:hypothetical protein
MKIEKIALSKITPSPTNPRIIKDDKFNKLVKSIQEFPQMLQIRPIVVDETGTVLGGNMRYKACKAAGLEEVYIIRAEALTEAQKKEFVIKDNASFGDWDWEILQNEWDMTELPEWGIDVFELPKEIDYSILDSLDEEGSDEFDKKLEEKRAVSRALCIPFKKEHYDEAANIVKKAAKNENIDLGGILLEALRKIK